MEEYNKQEKYNKKLLVEGSNDQHVVWNLCDKFNITENFDVIDCKSVDGAFKELKIRLKQSETGTIGIIVDADKDCSTRWRAVREILTNNDLPIEDDFSENGFIFKKKPKIGVWIMPNNKDTGKLEDFFEQLIPEKDNVISEVEKTLQKIENKNVNRYSEKDRPKAKIYTWLAWQKNPGMPMGLTIKSNENLSTDNETCEKFVTWLKNLVNSTNKCNF
jgi:hypothetical protein